MPCCEKGGQWAVGCGGGPRDTHVLDTVLERLEQGPGVGAGAAHGSTGGRTVRLLAGLSTVLAGLLLAVLAGLLGLAVGTLLRLAVSSGLLAILALLRLSVLALLLLAIGALGRLAWDIVSGSFVR